MEAVYRQTIKMLKRMIDEDAGCISWSICFFEGIGVIVVPKNSNKEFLTRVELDALLSIIIDDVADISAVGELFHYNHIEVDNEELKPNFEKAKKLAAVYLEKVKMDREVELRLRIKELKQEIHDLAKIYRV